MLSIIFTIYSGGSENFQCGNLRLYKYVAVKNVGIKVQLLSTDWIPPFLIQLLLLLYYVTYLHYIIHLSNIKVFSENNKTERFCSVLLLIFFRKNNSFIQLNCNEVINRINNYENYDWYPNTEVRID